MVRATRAICAIIFALFSQCIYTQLVLPLEECIVIVYRTATIITKPAHDYEIIAATNFVYELALKVYVQAAAAPPT